MKAQQFAPNVYRIRNDSAAFGQVRKIGRQWHAEIRNTETGELIRHAGIWSSLSDASEECTYQIPRNQPLCG